MKELAKAGLALVAIGLILCAIIFTLGVLSNQTAELFMLGWNAIS